MATTEAALVSLLVQGSSNPVRAIIGTRAYPEVLPQAPLYPAIRYQRIDTQRAQFRTMATGRSQYAKPRFQIDCYAATPAAAKALGDAVSEVLSGLAGLVAGVAIGSIALEDEASDVEVGVGVGGAPVFRRRLDFLVGHAEG